MGLLVTWHHRLVTHDLEVDVQCDSDNIQTVIAYYQGLVSVMRLRGDTGDDTEEYVETEREINEQEVDSDDEELQTHEEAIEAEVHNAEYEPTFLDQIQIDDDPRDSLMTLAEVALSNASLYSDVASESSVEDHQYQHPPTQTRQHIPSFEARYHALRSEAARTQLQLREAQASDKALLARITTL